MRTWGDENNRPRAGQLAKRYPRQTKALVKEMWEDPTSEKLRFMLEVLNQTYREIQRMKDIESKAPICDRCMEGEESSMRHLMTCPANGDIIDKALGQIGEILGKTVTTDGTEPQKCDDYNTSDPIHTRCWGMLKIWKWQNASGKKREVTLENGEIERIKTVHILKLIRTWTGGE